MNVQGKHIVITGPTAGIGRSTALELASKGAQLTLLCRSEEKGRVLRDEIIALGGLPPALVIMDMARLDSVRTAAQELIEKNQAIDILVNNAGIVNTVRRETVDGFEETLAVNHFAPFVLTGMLLPLISPGSGSRIVNVASGAHTFVRDMGFDDMQARQSYKTFREYGRSKLANILFTRYLASKLEGTGITVNCLHPGAVATSLASQNKGLSSKVLPFLLKPFFRSPQRGAETSIYLCTSPEVSDISGKYFANCKVTAPKPWGQDDEAAAKLWAFTEDKVSFKYDF
jgi:retinol dehydrogenase-12